MSYNRGITFIIIAEERDFSPIKKSRAALESSASASVSAGSTLPDLKQPRPEADQLPPCNAEFKNLVKPCQRYTILLHAVHVDILSLSKLDRMAIS